MATKAKMITKALRGRIVVTMKKKIFSETRIVSTMEICSINVKQSLLSTR